MINTDEHRWEVRRAGEVDFPIWAQMLASLHPETSEAEFLAELHELVALDDPYVAFLAFDAEGRAVGMIDARERNYAEDSPELRAGYVEDLWVTPPARNKGVARALLAAVEEWALAQGHCWLGSDTTLENFASQQWHAAVGFREVERLVVFGKPLADCGAVGS
jgi:aminoglycoside 6'-N-acetyltransferase I